MGAADRVRKLAALAGSDNVHEANEAARQACRLIREGKVALRDAAPDDGDEDDPRRAPPQRDWPFAAWWTPAPPPPPPPSRRRVVPRGPFARSPSTTGATCVACGEEIPPGDAFACEGGYVHGDCVPPRERP